DLIFPNFDTDDVSALLGKGDGTFQAQQRFAAGDGARFSDTGDFNGDGRADIAVSNGFSRDVSILLSSGPGAIGNFVWNDGNGNGVQDASEPGVAGATVELFDPVDGIAGNGNDVLVGARVTDGGGQYSFGNLNSGSYYLTFHAPSGYRFTTADA